MCSKTFIGINRGIDVDNVVLTDMISSGFEIENPRITDEREMSWIKDKYEPTYFDIRDDMMNPGYCIKIRKEFLLYRTCCKHRKLCTVASADAMYNGEYHSYNGSGWVRRKQKILGRTSKELCHEGAKSQLSLRLRVFAAIKFLKVY